MKNNLAMRLRGCLAVGLWAIIAMTGLLATPGTAIASPGCQGINGRSGTFTTDVPGGYFILPASLFNLGDVATLTVSGSSTPTSLVRLFTSSNTRILINGNGSGSYTFPGYSNETAHTQRDDSDPGSLDYTVGCVSIVPTLTSRSPGSGVSGSTVTLTGTGFYGTSAVKFGATDAASFTVDSGTQITATVPAGSGTVAMSVTTDAGTAVGPNFTLIAPPTVTSISPTAGPTAGGTSVTITGTNFSGVTAVTFGATAATGFTFNSATQITATAPAGTGTVDVRVTTAGGTSAANAADQFTYIGAPAIAAISPSAGPASGGTTVVINGTNFSGTTAVTFGATAATGFTVNSATQVTAIAPAQAAGTVDVRVTTAGGTSATNAADQFTYVGAPSVTSISPNTGPTSGGTTVIITGVRFSGTAAVTFGATPAIGFTVNSATQITATAPAGTGTVDVRVTTAGGTSAANAADQFTYVGAPSVTSISPSAGPASGGTSVTITGLRFSGTAAVTFGATPAIGFTVNSATQITATAPAGTGTVDVRVTTAGGTSPTNAADQFTYVGAPSVSFITPSVGSTSGGTTVTLFGANFSGATAITFGAAPATGFIVNSATQITATSPAQSAGTVDVRVTTVGGTSSTSAADQFTFVVPAIANNVTATVGSNSGSNPITLNITGIATSVAIAVDATNGIATVTGPASISYTPTNGYSGADSFSYTATNAAGTSALATVSITVNATVPGAPTIGTATAGNSQATVSFTAPANNGGAAITGYTVTSNPGSVTATCAGSPCTVTGLNNGTSYTFTVASTNAAGTGNASTASNAVVPQGPQLITNFVANPAAPVFAPNGTFAVSATGGGSSSPLVFASTTNSVCTVSGSTVTMLNSGACSLTANQAGDAGYLSAPQVGLNLVIAQALPTLGWIAPVNKILGDAAFDLPNPGSNSTGTFTFGSSNNSVATVSGRTVTIVGAGVTTLTATQAASGNYTQGTITTTLTVSARPDPTLDPDVKAGVQAQVDASVRFANAQQNNIHDRLRTLRNSDGNPSSNGLSLNVLSQSGAALSLAASQFGSEDRAPPAHDWGLWTAGTITTGDRGDQASSNGYDLRSDGVTIGFDHALSQQWVIGAAFGLGWNDTDFDLSSLDADQRSLSVYGLWRGDANWFVDGLLGTGKLGFDIRRWSSDANAMATGQRDGDQNFASLTFGYQGGGDDMKLTGYGRFDASRSKLDAYNESGIGIYNLSYGRQNISSSTLALGLEGSYLFKRSTGSLRPFWMLEYRDALQNNGNVDINYVVLPTSNDYVLGVRSYNSDGYALGGGLDIDLDSGWAFSLSLRREHASGGNDSNSFGLRFSYTPAMGSEAVALPKP